MADEQFDASAAVDAYLANSTPTNLKTSLALTAGQNPDYEAETRRLGKTLGLPPQAVATNIDQSRKDATLAGFDSNQYAKDFPTAARFLSDPENAAIAHDNADSLSGFDTLFQTAVSTLRAIPAGLQKMAGNTVYGGGRLATSLLSEYTGGPDSSPYSVSGQFAGISNQFARLQKRALGMGDTIAGDNTGNFVSKSIVSGGESLGRMLPGMVASVITKNPEYALLTGAADAGLQASSNALDAGKSAAQALFYGAEDATAEYATELLPMHYLIKDLKVGAPFMKLLGHQIMTELPTELVATPWQNFNEWANLHPDQPFKSYLDALPEAEAQTAISTITTTLLTAGFGKGIHSIASRAARGSEDAKQAEHGAAFIDGMNKLAAADKLLARSPDNFHGFIAAANENGPVQSVFIDGKALMQSGIAPEIASLSPAVREQLDNAVLTGGQIAIPVDEYATKIAPTKYASQLLDHLKTDPDGFSRAEAQDFMANSGAELLAEVERLIGDQQGADAFRASQEAVKTDILNNLNTSNRFTPQVNEAYSSLVSAYSAVRAAQIGITPEEFHAKHGIDVVADDVGGADHYDQTGKLVTDTPAFKNWFGDSKVADSDGKPLVLYHGTKSDFNTFQMGQADRRDGGWFGDGFYLTGSKDLANSYAIHERDHALTKRSANVMPVYVKMENPYRINLSGMSFSEGSNFTQKFGGNDGFKAWLNENGYDGVIGYRDIDIAGQGAEHWEVVAFDPTKIKSAIGNRGTFDPNDPNILHQSANPVERYVKAWKTLASDDAIFQKPIPDSLDMEGAAKEIDPGMSAVSDPLDLEEAKYLSKKWYVKMPDGTHAYVMENKQGEVWIDASRLKEGASGGSKLYLLVGSYAEGNGKVFIGDPAGLSDVALIRRTENMLSLALKFGTTKFMRPHEYQMNPDAKGSASAGMVRPIDWVEGDDANNIAELIRTSYANTVALVPEIKNVTYNFDKRSFEQDGRKFTDADFAALAAGRNAGSNERNAGDTTGGSVRDGAGNDGAAEVSAPVGSATLKRTAVTNTLARAESAGRGRDLLDEVGRFVSRGLTDSGLAGTLYQSAKQHIYDQSQTEAFKKWSNNAPLVDADEANAYAFKSGDRVALVAFHGTKRPDRVGTKFLKKRATSGPMAFFTSSPDLASSYAQGKSDTSLSGENQDYSNWFKFKPKGSSSKVDIVRAWYSLDSETKAKIAETAPTLRMDENGENVIAEEGNTSGNGSYDYNLEQTQRSYDRTGNPLKALVEDWLNSGVLFGNEEKFMQVLDKAGFPKGEAEYDSPHAEYPFVYKTYIAMHKPLVSYDVPQEVVDALNEAAKKDHSRAKPLGSDSWDKGARTLREWVSSFNEDRDSGNNSYVWTSIPDKVTDVFRSLGYDGIIDKSGKGGSNEHPVYIPFEENQVKSAIGNKGKFDVMKNDILNQPGSSNGNRGFYSPETRTIGLLKSADLSSFLHEAGHYFFDNDIALASSLVAEARGLGYDMLKPGEREIIDGVSALLSWHGIQGDIEEQLRQWHTMDFEEQRSHHERTAESFEHYLFSGKAPSIELQPVFQRFSAWLLNVYGSLKKFLTSHPEAGKLTDEVRTVFDGMLATREQIALAEQGRSMMPLFTSPEQSGMTPDAFSAYHANGVDASNEAIQELQARGLRDMQWLGNAKSKVLKALQKDAASKRAEVMIDARREVMTQPIYQAWDFLTRKLTDNDKLPAPGRAKSDPNIVDPTQDSLFTAIAKLGGISKDQAISEWGIDPKSKPDARLFGKPVWRVTGGLPIDSMAEALSQHGYLPLNEHGQYELSDLGDRFLDESNGTPQFSIAYEPETDKQAGAVVNPSGLTAGRFDLESLETMGIPKEITDLIVGLKMTAKVGIDPDLVAADYGFDSGDELVRTLAIAEKPKAAIEALTDKLMLQRYGDITSQAALETAADQAIHNEVRARMVATEANVLAKATGKPKILATAAKEFAHNMIARIKVRDIRPSQYANSEVRAAKAAVKAEKEGNIQQAAAEKRNQLINLYAAKAAYDAIDEVDKGLRYLKRATSATALKNMRGESKAQMLAVLDRFDVRKAVSLKEIDRKQALADWAVGEAERLAAPVPILSEAVANEAVRTHYKNLTVDEFRGLIDSIKQLEHLARREHKAYIAIRNMSLQEEVSNAVAEIRTAWPKAFDVDGKAVLATPLTNQYAKTLGAKLQNGVRNLNAEFVPMEELIDQLTAGKFGLLHDSLFGRLSDASDRKSIMAGEIRDMLKPAYDAYTFKEKRDFSRVAVGDTGMTRENLLMLALYYGNVEGRQRLASQGFNDQQVLNRLRNLTDKDINLAEAIWSLNDDYIWPQYAALNERTQGKAPAKVEAAPMQINGRDIKGGYVKLVYDSAFDETTRHRDSMDDAMAMIGGRANVSAKTNQGSSIERVKEISKMPLLELRAMSQAVNEHMHDIAYREAVADTVRVLRTGDMRDAIKAVAGDPVYTELLSKVNEIAARPRDPSGMVLKGLNLARKNTIVVLMSGIKTALVNYSGLIPALTRVNAGSLAKNIAKVHSWRMGEMIEFAKANSSYMMERNQQFTSDLQHEMASLTVQNKLVPEMGTFLIMMRMIDQVTSTSVWNAAYEDGMSELKDHDRAVEYANNVTRSTQGSGRDVDTSKIMTRFGPWSKPFTMFYSFFNRQLALLVRQGVISKQAWESGRKAEAIGKFTAAYIAIVVLPALINDMAAGRCDKAMAGDEGWTRCISKAIVMNMSGFVPVLRDFVPYVWGKLDSSEPNYGLRMTPASAYFEGIGSGISSAVDVAKGKGNEKDTKAIVMGLSYLFGLPGLLMWNVTAGTEAVLNDGAPAQAVLFGPPKH
jgi:phosphopantetheine adenylyltransferase